MPHERRRARRTPLSFEIAPAELLESRRLLSTASVVGDVLVVEGTQAADVIQIGAAGAGRLRVLLDGRDAGVFGPVSSIAVDAGEGDDVVALGPGVRTPAVIHGGAGDDRLRGGSGPDQVYGDAGDDALITSASRDLMDAGPGSNRLAVAQRMGTIYVGPSASGDALRVLSKAYSLRQAGGLGPMIVGAGDLDDPGMARLLQRAYDAGETVSITNASPRDADRLAALVGHVGGIDWDGGVPRADLVSLRLATRPDGGTNYITEIVAPRAHSATPARPAGRRQADQGDLLSYSKTFAAIPESPSLPGDTPKNDLTNLANSYQNKSRASDDQGDAIQVLNTIWSARSFLNQADYYYLLEEFDVEYGGIAPISGWANGISSFQDFPSTIIIQPSPQSTMETTSETASVSYTLGGSVGWNQKQGVNASVSGSVTVTKSKTITFPPVQIQNMTDLTQASGNWIYTVNDLPSGWEQLTFYNSFIWEVPFTAYGSLNAMPYSTSAALTLGTSNNPTLTLGLPQINVSLPFPFGKVFSLQDPKITGLSSSFVEEGDTFTISGSGFYPSLVEGVLIGGTPLTSEQYTTVSDTQIRVVAPFLAAFSPVVVQTTEGTSNDDYTVTIY
jgi:hypothetical protein